MIEDTILSRILLKIVKKLRISYLRDLVSQIIYQIN